MGSVERVLEYSTVAQEAAAVVPAYRPPDVCVRVGGGWMDDPVLHHVVGEPPVGSSGPPKINVLTTPQPPTHTQL